MKEYKIAKFSPIKGNNVGDIMISKSIEFLLKKNLIEVDSFDLLFREPSSTSGKDVAQKTSIKTKISSWLQFRHPRVFYQIKKLMFKMSRANGKFDKISNDYDGLVFGGGNVLMTKFGSDYGLRIAQFSARTPKPVFIYAAGAGPFQFDETKLTYEIGKNVEYLSLRDDVSMSYFLDHNSIKACKHIDPAFVTSDMTPVQKRSLKFLGVNLIDNNLSDENLDLLVSNVYNFCLAKNLGIKFITTAYPGDSLAVSQAVSMLKKMPEKIEIQVCDLAGNAQMIAESFSDVAYFLGTRMHSLIFALSFSVPTIGIPWDRKVQSMFNEFFGEFYSTELIYNSNVELDYSFYDKINLNSQTDSVKDRIYIEANELSLALKREVDAYRAEES